LNGAAASVFVLEFGSSLAVDRAVITHLDAVWDEHTPPPRPIAIPDYLHVHRYTKMSSIEGQAPRARPGHIDRHVKLYEYGRYHGYFLDVFPPCVMQPRVLADDEVRRDLRRWVPEYQTTIPPKLQSVLPLCSALIR